jgi:hypothetical protein
MVLGMKTTLEIGDALFRQAKRRAADEGITFRQLVERALRADLAGTGRPAPRGLKWYVVKGTAPPAIDVVNRDVMYDFLDER